MEMVGAHVKNEEKLTSSGQSRVGKHRETQRNIIRKNATEVGKLRINRDILLAQDRYEWQKFV